MLFDENNSDLARSDFAMALKKDPDFWLASKELGAINADYGNMESAIKEYRKALKHSNCSEDWVLHYLYALALYDNERFEEAEPEFRRAIDLEPEAEHARNFLGVALIKQNKLEEALAVFQDAIERGLDGRFPLRNKGWVLEKMKRYQEALEAWMVFGGDKPNKDTQGHIETLTRLLAVPSTSNEASLTNLDKSDEFSVVHKTRKATSIARKRRSDMDKRTKEKELRLELGLEDDIEHRIKRGTEKIFERWLEIYDGDHYGRQYPCPPFGKMDLLCVDKDSGEFVVIELKKDDKYGDVVEQITRYMKFVNDELDGEKRGVGGIICVSRATDTLKTEAANKGVRIFQYEVRISAAD